MQLSRGESVGDTARVLSRYVDAIVIRSGSHEAVAELADAAEVPVVNALTPLHHPCQALADLLTLRERFGELDGLRLAYVGDGNNVARSLAIAGELAGVEVVVAAPPGYQLEEGHGAKLTDDPRAAAAGADAIYTDVWVSMGDEEEAERRRADLAPFRVDADLLAAAKDGAIVLHCLPAHPGEEITADVLYGDALGGLGPGREPAARPEGAAGGAARRLARQLAHVSELDIGPLTLQTFGLMFALAFLAAGALIWKRLGEIGKPSDWAYEMGFAALIGGIVGSRVYFIVQNYDERQGRPARQPLLRRRAGLVRRRDRRRPRGPRLGLVARLPRPRPARPGGAGAGARLRDRPLRLPALRRRRLRQALGRALGDVLPGRDGAHRPHRPPDADLRDAGDGPRRLDPLAAARPGPRRRPLRDLPGLRRDRALPGRVPAPQHRGLGRADQRPAGEPGDDDRWNCLDRYRDPPARRHRAPNGERCGSTRGL